VSGAYWISPKVDAPVGGCVGFTQLFSTAISLFSRGRRGFCLLQAQTCSTPDALQWIAITALVASMIGAVGVFAVSSAVAIAAVATSIVQGILTGASIAVIVTTIEVDLSTTGVSVGLIVAMVNAIKEILGC
jgi:hypothetical protein